MSSGDVETTVTRGAHHPLGSAHLNRSSKGVKGKRPQEAKEKIVTKSGKF